MNVILAGELVGGMSTVEEMPPEDSAGTEDLDRVVDCRARDVIARFLHRLEQLVDAEVGAKLEGLCQNREALGSLPPLGLFEIAAQPLFGLQQ